MHTLVLCSLAVGVVFTFGCRPSPPPTPVEVPKPRIPAVTETPDQIRAEMRQFAPFSPEFEQARFKLLVKYDEIIAREGVEGFEAVPAPKVASSSAVLDPKSGQIAWRAMTCFNPDCPARGKGGGPYLFAYKIRNIKVGPNGNLMIDRSVSDEPRDPIGVKCPVCGKYDFCRIYESPEAIVRRDELMKELAILRGRKAKKQENNTASKTKRTAMDVMNELAERPKLFLLPDDDKVRFTDNDLIVPNATGTQ